MNRFLSFGQLFKINQGHIEEHTKSTRANQSSKYMDRIRRKSVGILWPLFNQIE